MTREEIKEYLNRVDKLLDKLKGEDKETLSWLIYGYNQCAKLLNETQKENEKLKAEYGTKVQVERDLLKEENEKLKAVINKAIEYIENYDAYKEFTFPMVSRATEKQMLASVDFEIRKFIKSRLLKILEVDSNEYLYKEE